VKLGLLANFLLTYPLVNLKNMMLKPNSMPKQNSNYEAQLKRPKPPSPEMVQRAQPFRADVVQMDAAIKHPTYQVVE
jgi:hypothetical protein